MTVNLEEMQLKLDSAFERLRQFPIIQCATIEYKEPDDTTQTFIAKQFINGNQIEEGTIISEFLTDTFEEALQKTKECIDEILKEYDKVWLRVFPELSIRHGKYAIYFRMAF